jgi:uncharacterized SAM-binding protein YcdF (DUF218 family)
VNVWPVRLLARWLARAEPLEAADLIFALAGRQHRKSYALRLYQNGYSPRLILSVGRFEIRRFALLPFPVRVPLLETAAAIPAPKRHFFVCLEGDRAKIEAVPWERLGTLREIRALGRWLRERPEIKSVLVVTSGVHLRRVRWCCRALLDQGVVVGVTAAPDLAGDTHDPRDSIFKEFVKLLAYGLYLPVQRRMRSS